MLTLAGLALLEPPGQGRRAGAQPGQVKRPRWEYGELLYRRTIDRKGYDVIWDQPGSPLKDTSWAGLLKQLTGKEGGGAHMAVLNVLGEQGWELVSAPESGTSNSRRWTFKRAK